MTQEDKELLLKDLCARLPYGVKVNISACANDDYDNYIPSVNDATLNSINLNTERCKFREFWWDKFIVDVRPYLRSMSSMTEEEKQEMSDGSSLAFESALNGISGYCPETMAYSTFNVDFCLTHHLDFRGLIEKGLAIEVTEENNPYERNS